MNKQYYTPNIAKPQTATTGTFRAVSLESDAIIQRVSKDLYANPASGVREILANEIRAAISAKEQGADPRIEVTIMPDMIRVWGIDSLGMERDIFDTVYMTLGRSSNFDGKTPGQFGLGRAAYMTISDHMLLETKHRNGDNYSVLGVEGRGYQTDLPEPDIPYGTRITMAPRERVTDAMIRMVTDTAKRSPVPIRLITAEQSVDLEQEDLAESFTIHATRPDVEIGIIGKHDGRHASYLCGIPISFEYRGAYNIDSVSVDIHDERKYQPTPDRERMTEKAEFAISGIIDDVVRERLKDFPRDIAGAMAHPDRRLAYDVMGGRELPGLDRTVISYESSWRRRLGNIAGSPVINCSSFDSRRIEAVLAQFPNAAFVKECPELPHLTDFIKRHGIKATRPRGTRPKDSRAVIHTKYGATRIDAQYPPADNTVYKVANGQALKDNATATHDDGIALTIHDVEGATDLEAAKAKARRHRFKTSRGPMTGKQLLDSKLHVAPTTRASLLDCWGGIDAKNTPDILVLTEYSGQYQVLKWQSGKLDYHLYIPHWMDNTHAMETYLRLKNPTHKRLMEKCHHAHDAQFCDDFMEMDNQLPLQHDHDCRCGNCN